MVARRKRFWIWWRRGGMAMRLSLSLIVMALLGLLVFLQSPDEESANATSNLLFFILINLTIVVIGVLAFLIGRNIVKLFFDRRRGILGSKLRQRLVIAFVGLTMVPTILLSILASGLLNTAMEGWFGRQVEDAVEGAMGIAKRYYDEAEGKAVESSELIKSALQEDPELLAQGEKLREFLDQERRRYGYFSLRIFKTNRAATERQIVAETVNANAVTDSLHEPELSKELMSRALLKTPLVLSEKGGESQFIRIFHKLSGDGLVFVATMLLDPDLSYSLGAVVDSYDEYKRLTFFKQPLKSSYLLTLAMITGIILFAAIWIGFYLAREIAVPIQRLAEGTKAVASGNYDLYIRSVGDDEIGRLVKDFNQMTADLKSSHEIAERRRMYIETILANLAVGVIAIDRGENVTLVNHAAARMLSIAEHDGEIQSPSSERKLQDLLGEGPRSQLARLLDSIRQQDDLADLPECELNIESIDGERNVVCTSGRMIDEQGEWFGTVLLFDDITELSRAQHMSAWREVARRIAHEIKNPLTPIQLSAQRLQKYMEERGLSNELVTDCSDTIVQNVDSIKRLANEFSRFARMPVAEFEGGDLNELISETVVPYSESHPELTLQLIADQRMPEISMDREQIRRMLINLIENAIQAMERDPAKEGIKLLIRTSFDRRQKSVMIEVADNGPGIPAGDKSRVFEPYFTTKSHGTGLGLAIVNTIVSDHQGQIRVYDNTPRGAKFVVTLPVTPKPIALRRYGGIV